MRDTYHEWLYTLYAQSIQLPNPTQLRHTKKTKKIFFGRKRWCVMYYPQRPDTLVVLAVCGGPSLLVTTADSPNTTASQRHRLLFLAPRCDLSLQSYPLTLATIIYARRVTPQAVKKSTKLWGITFFEHRDWGSFFLKCPVLVDDFL